MVYLLTRKSDQRRYVGITIDDRMSNRMSQHRSSANFVNDSFSIEVLEESTDRSYIESREGHWISEYNTFNDGLNKTAHGKGHGHDSPAFSTLDHVFSDESRKKMSDSAKARCRSAEWKKKQSSISAQLWVDPAYREKQIKKRKGKRLRAPKLSDHQVAEIRDRWSREKDHWTVVAKTYNQDHGRHGSAAKKPHSLFCEHIQKDYGVTLTTLSGIVRNKCRLKSIPQI